MVEVRHDHLKALVFFAKQMVARHFHIVELYVGRAGGRRVGGLDKLRLNSLASFDDQHRHALLGLAGGDEVVAEHAIGDPFLGSIDDVVRAICGQLCGRSDACNIATGEGFSPAVRQ